MNNFTKILDKDDRSYLAALLFFAIIAMFRFFDKKLQKHGAVFPFMEEYPIAIAMMFIYFIVLFVFFTIVIAQCKQENKKTMYYLTAFLSVFAFPMFLPKYYFGNMDMYAWMLMFISCALFVTEKAQFLTVVICALMMYISPMSLFNCGCLIMLLYTYQFFVNGQKKNLRIAVLSLIAGVTGAIISIVINGLNIDAQSVLTIEKFFVSIILLSPYLLIAYSFFKGVIAKSDKKKAYGWMILLIGVLPTIVSNFIIGDYVRVLVYVFLYFIFATVCLMALRDEVVEEQMCETKELLKKHVPIPVIVIAYPLLIMIFWIAGPITLYKEKFLGK